MALSAETKVGILAFIAIGALALGFDFLKGNRTFERGRTYYAVYDRVPGLQSSDPVKVNDLMVGRVKDLTLLPDYRVLARLVITEDFPIPADSRLMISASDLLGAKQLDLMVGKSSQLAVSGDTLRGVIQIGIQEEIREELKPITDKFQDLIAQIDTAVILVSSIFSEELGSDVGSGVSAVSTSLENFRSISFRLDQMVAEQSGNVGSIFENLEAVTEGLARNQENFDAIIGNLERITDSLAAAELAQTVSEARLAIASLGRIVGHVESGQGSLGMLVSDDSLYQNLKTSTEHLDQLLLDVTLLRIGGRDKKNAAQP